MGNDRVSTPSSPTLNNSNKPSARSIGFLISYSSSVDYHHQSNETFRNMGLPCYFRNESTLLSTLNDMQKELSLITLSSSVLRNTRADDDRRDRAIALSCRTNPPQIYLWVILKNRRGQMMTQLTSRG